MQLLQFLFRTSHKMLVILSNCKEKRLPFPFLERATSCVLVSLLLLRLGLCILGHPSHAGHRVRSSARLTLSISLFGPVRPCVPLKNNLFHRTYLCRSRLAEAEGRSFFAERCRHPGGGFCAVLRGFGAYFSSPWAYPQQTAVRDSRSPCLSLCQPALFLGKRSIPWLWRCAFCAVSVFDSGRSLWAVPMQPPGRPFPYGVCVHAPFAPEASAVPGFYADFGSVDSALRNAFPFPNSRWIWNRALQTFGSWGHPVGCRWTENPCVPVFLRGPSLSGASAPLSSVSAFARRNSALRVSEKAGLWKKSSRRVFCLVSRGPPPRLCQHCARGGDLSAMPVSFNCRVLPIFWMLRPARFPGLCPCASAHPGLAGRVPISGFPLDRSCSQPRSFAQPAACGFSPSDDFFELPLSRSLYATPLLHPYQTHAVKALARSISGSRRHATAGDLGLFSIRHWKRPLSFFLSIL